MRALLGSYCPSVSRGFVASPRLSEGTGGPCAGAEPGLKQGLTVFPQPWPRVQRGNWNQGEIGSRKNELGGVFL